MSVPNPLPNITNSRSELKVKKREVTTLLEEISRLKTQSESYRAFAGEMADKILTPSTNLNGGEHEIEAVRREGKQMEANYKQLLEGLKATAAREQELAVNRVLSDSGKREEELRQELKEKNATIQQLQLQTDSLRNELWQCQESNGTYRHRVVTLENELGTARKDQAEHRHRLGLLSNREQHLQGVVQSSQREAEELRFHLYNGVNPIILIDYCTFQKRAREGSARSGLNVGGGGPSECEGRVVS